MPVRAGGGVALRINTTAAAADTDKPQTGRKLIERESRRYMDAASTSVHSASNNTRDNSTYFTKQPPNNRDCERQSTLRTTWSNTVDAQNAFLESLHVKWRAWGPGIHFSSAARLMSCALTSPSCRKARPLRSVLMGCTVHSWLHCHHTTSVSVGTCESLRLNSQRGLINLCIDWDLQPDEPNLTILYYQHWRSCWLLSISIVLLGSGFWQSNPY